MRTLRRRIDPRNRIIWKPLKLPRSTHACVSRLSFCKQWASFVGDIRHDQEQRYPALHAISYLHLGAARDDHAEIRPVYTTRPIDTTRPCVPRTQTVGYIVHGCVISRSIRGSSTTRSISPRFLCLAALRVNRGPRPRPLDAEFFTRGNDVTRRLDTRDR